MEAFMAKCTEIKLFARLGTVEKTKSEKERKRACFL